ncbi:MAG: Tm-1-like ATP-binding domain-containing protein [Gaiellaceae bacterium]|jgi:uncharacterized protein (UPF0261 family)
MTTPQIVLIGTLDTKGFELDYTARVVERLGARSIVVDSGILGEPDGCRADVTRAEVAAAAGYRIDDLRNAGSRGAAVERMLEGVRAVCLRLLDEGRLDGVLCLGGAEGAILGAAAMRVLPVGIPKVLVSPSASGRRPFGDFVGLNDMVVMHSVVDILGLNPIARSVFQNAAAAVVGMARDGSGRLGSLGENTVGLTMLGHTTPAVMRIRTLLEETGHEPVVFHANGVGGPAMESLARAGSIAGVIDYTLSELANTVMDGIHTTGPERLTVAGELGLTQVVVPGCADFFNQGAPSTLPERYRSRKCYYHNPVATLVRLAPEEMVELGRMIAARLNPAKGPVAVVAPTRGFSLADVPGGALWDPEADAALLDTLGAELRPDIPFERVETHVNDPEFADLVAERYLALATRPARRAAAKEP